MKTHDWDRVPTQAGSKALDSREGSSGPLIVVSRRGKLIALHSPSSNVTRLGRSSRCDIRIDDPYFPRFAGEVILEPVPLFRISNRDQDGPSVKVVGNQRSVEILSYRIRVLLQGEATVVRRGL